MTVLAADRWRTNGHLIEACAQLGYLSPDDVVLDATYGRGSWWAQWQPAQLTTHDLALDGVDFRSLPEPDDTFDAAAFDPPYVSVGGRATTTIPAFHDRYGMAGTPKSPLALQQLINDGLTELARVVRPRGVVLAKCQDYVSSGQLWVGTHHTLTHAMGLGFSVVDRLEMLTDPRPQPPHRRQVHARRNYSTLFVLRAPS